MLAGLGFLWILVKTYTTSEGLPDPELLALMGLSSAGYFGGKLARKPGPIIQRMEVAEGSVVLKMFGQHLDKAPGSSSTGSRSRASIAVLNRIPIIRMNS